LHILERKFTAKYKVTAIDFFNDAADPCWVEILNADRSGGSQRSDQQDQRRERGIETSLATDWQREAWHSGRRAQFPPEQRRGELVALAHDQKPVFGSQFATNCAQRGAQRLAVGVVFERHDPESFLRNHVPRSSHTGHQHHRRQQTSDKAAGPPPPREPSPRLTRRHQTEQNDCQQQKSREPSLMEHDRRELERDCEDQSLHHRRLLPVPHRGDAEGDDHERKCPVRVEVG